MSCSPANTIGQGRSITTSRHRRRMIAPLQSGNQKASHAPRPILLAQTSQNSTHPITNTCSASGSRQLQAEDRRDLTPDSGLRPPEYPR
ncbi:hypothetical protein CORC01_13256 [Colletotrichum orchidophilum]|uniref:Uncharacterized protein n=1 Tax=Colletotrichum orchidophilum TaxID=1209926 RepID=A0A1G4AQI7_9PEZI|nr:uncharacterized protein CORC01_13256 [Colletotrichum orchidophilum]OHE91437.1 hypothetical protein CORC01_13256 [Colletotrichum orchidophilum]